MSFKMGEKSLKSVETRKTNSASVGKYPVARITNSNLPEEPNALNYLRMLTFIIY